MKNQMDVWTAQRELLREVNPILVTAGFEEILKFHLGDESVGLAAAVAPRRDRAPNSGSRPARCSARCSGRAAARERTFPSGDLLTSEALARASGDESPEVRAEAVRALRELRSKDLLDPLARIASNDPSQNVRYEAQLGVMELRGGS
jgi:hypothetical protein